MPRNRRSSSWEGILVGLFLALFLLVLILIGK